MKISTDKPQQRMLRERYMEKFIDKGNQNVEEMQSSETTQLVAPPSSTSKPSYINVFNNLCALIFVGIIAFCCFKNGVTLFSFHPVLLSVGWLLFMATAVNAVTPGDVATEWMPIRLRSARHWVIQLFAASLVLAGFIVILSNKIIHGKSHFQTLHAKFGLSSLVFMTGTMLGGLAALYSLRLKHYIAPLYTKLLHASFGLITFSLGIITIILALFSAWWSFGDILRYSCLVFVLIVMVCTILRPILKIYFRLKERVSN